MPAAATAVGYAGCDTYDRCTTWDGSPDGRGVVRTFSAHQRDRPLRASRPIAIALPSGSFEYGVALKSQNLLFSGLVPRL